MPTGLPKGPRMRDALGGDGSARCSHLDGGGLRGLSAQGPKQCQRAAFTGWCVPAMGASPTGLPSGIQWRVGCVKGLVWSVGLVAHRLMRQSGLEPTCVSLRCQARRPRRLFHAHGASEFIMTKFTLTIVSTAAMGEAIVKEIQALHG